MGAVRKPDRYVQHWETVTVTALPHGWRNVFRLDDTGELHYTPCPALLLQEHRETVRCWDARRADGAHDVRTSTEQRDPPYETRVAFADFDRSRSSDLGAATEIGNYVGTVAPGEEWT